MKMVLTAFSDALIAGRSVIVMSSGAETSLDVSGNSKRFLDFARNDKRLMSLG
jgi:hypothetical protein